MTEQTINDLPFKWRGDTYCFRTTGERNATLLDPDGGEIIRFPEAWGVEGAISFLQYGREQYHFGERVGRENLRGELRKLLGAVSQPELSRLGASVNRALEASHG